MSVKTKEGEVKKREIIGEGCGVREEGRVRRRKNCKRRGEGEQFAGPSVVGRRTLQIPVNRIQLRCYREYR